MDSMTTTTAKTGKSAKKAAKAAQKGDRVEGVLLAKAKRELVFAAGGRLNLWTCEPVGLDVAVARLQQHYSNVTAKSDLADCDTCGGVSDVALDACPFCGDGDDEPNPVKGKAPSKVRATLAPAEAALPPGATPAALDAAVEEVRALKGEAGAGFWRLGRRIADIFEGQLYKARTDNDGKPIYKHWNQFCAAELDMTPASAYSLMDVARHFDEAQVKAVGHTKLNLLLRAPEEKQPELLEQAKTASYRELAEKVAAVKPKGKKRITGRKLTPAGKPGTKPAKVHDGKVTVAALLGAFTIPLFAKPAGPKAQLEKRAKRLADQPVGVHDLLNDVRLFVSVVETPSGELAVRCVLKRVE